MIDPSFVFESVRRDYKDFEDASSSEIESYSDSFDSDSLNGHISNIKGILFEKEVVDALNDQGVSAELFEAPNHPISDIAIFDDDGDITAELQLKATDSVDYILSTLEENPDVPIVATHEVAQQLIDNDMVIDSGIDNEALTEAVSSTLTGSDLTDAISDSVSDSVSDTLADVVADTVIPIGPISLLRFGIGLLTGLF